MATDSKIKAVVKEFPTANKSVEGLLKEALTVSQNWEGLVLIALNNEGYCVTKTAGLNVGEINWLCDVTKLSLMRRP